MPPTFLFFIRIVTERVLHINPLHTRHLPGQVCRSDRFDRRTGRCLQRGRVVVSEHRPNRQCYGSRRLPAAIQDA